MKHAKEGNETGVSVFGKIRPNKVCVVTKIIKAGPRAERGPVSFTTDEKEISKILEYELAVDKDVRYLADLHSHPWPSEPTPSDIDINQLKRARKLRPLFVIGVLSSTGKIRFFGLNGDSPKEIPYQVIPDDFSEEDLLARISKFTDNEKLQKIRVGVLGCGSLGSAVVAGLAGSGIGEYVLCDMDEFSLVNVVRHTGGINQIGKPKTAILSEYIQFHNPLANVLTVDDDLIKNAELLRAVIESCDMIVASSGNPELNFHINSICVELNKPAVYGGIYAGAKSAYVFCVPGKDHACFDCIFQLTSTAIDQNTLKRKYGLEDGELKQAQGMFADISIPGSVMAKITLQLILGKEFNFNLVRYFDTLKLSRLNVSKRKLCPTCDYQNWLKEEEEKMVSSTESTTKKFVKKLKKKFRRKKNDSG
ncbi:MAG: ThiF family adenylyltransferase [Nitrososphaera sp.]|jgi:molybdopterin/thiamine biosynthesis adenylyltransferase